MSRSKSSNRCTAIPAWTPSEWGDDSLDPRLPSQPDDQFVHGQSCQWFTLINCRASKAGGVAMTSTRAGYVVGGRYRLVAELGSGGFGRVWQARDETLDVDVAVKELQLLPGMSQAEQADRLKRATREARNAARLRNHENIVAIHDVVVEDGLPWIVMELIDGCSLNEHIKAHGPLPVERAASVAVALLAAIGAAHQEGVVHRDIKPANVMLARNGKVLLTDFGIAVHSTDTALTATGMFIGSLEYTAPERLGGTEGLPASDLFSLGVTLYQAVEGVSPFRRDTPHATLTAVLLEEAPAPQRAGRLTQLITRLLDKDPDKRPTAAEALTMTGERPPSQVHLRHKAKILTTWETQKGWQGKGAAVIMALIVALGVARFAVEYAGGRLVLGLHEGCMAYGFPGGCIWRGPISMDPLRVTYYEDSGLARIALLLALIVDVYFAGLLCARIARFVLRAAGQTVAVLVSVVGFLFGGAATYLALDGVMVILLNAEPEGLQSAMRVSLIATGIAILIAWRLRPRSVTGEA
ncbi:serine/threonine-protein kinase [Streptosporangium sp. NPDC000396]|uniref:serine/threonine-protein kinase n=1 Tax=Streptosporangium sp. NPDC000396 TaxID=3366185 RepID=UPI0036A081C6